ncbi:MAG: hypothetical protein RLZZ176_3004, partial [Cyanobacteriota bacterium]
PVTHGGNPQDRAGSPSRVEASTPVALPWGCPHHVHLIASQTAVSYLAIPNE